MQWRRMHRPTRHCKCLLVRGWALSSVRNFQGTLHGRPCRSRAARCSQSCRARDGACSDILFFSRLLSDRILRPPTCLVRPAVRPALGVGSRHAAMHLREAQGKSMDTIMATGDEWTPEWRFLAQLAKPHQKIAQFRAPLRPHRRHHHRGSTPSGAMVSATVHVATKSCGRRPRACVRG